MKFNPDQCLHCQNPDKPEKPWAIHDFWFCNVDCLFEEVAKFLPREYGLDKNPWDGQEMKDFGEEPDDGNEEYTKRRIKEISQRWHEKRNALCDEAIAKIEKQIEIQSRILRRDRGEKERGAREKEEERERIAREKEEVRLEEERLAQEEEERRLERREIPKHVRLEHTHILAPSGSGKTQFIINTILTDHDTDQNPPTIIFIDPKGIAVDTLSFIRRLKDRLVIVDPLQKPALSLFATQGRTPTQLISDFAYIFSTTNQDLTGKQAPCFSFCARLLFTLPNADLFTFLDLLEDRADKKKPPNPIFLEAIPKLPPVARRFFETDYYSANYAATREQIKSRIWGVLENDTLAAILNAKRNKLDLAECIRARKTVLIHTRMTELKEAHQTFGRYIISLVQDAIQNRKERHPVYLIIDEFQEFADENKTPQMLRFIREYGGGVTIAHQNMFCREINDAIRSAISTNTSIKYAASPEGSDLGYMAKDLRCAPEFLKGIHKSEEGYRFACFVRGLVPPLQHPFVIYEKFGWSNEWPRTPNADYGMMKSINDHNLQDWPETHEQRKARSESETKTSNQEYKSLSTDTQKKNKQPKFRKLLLMNCEELERNKAEQSSSTENDNKPSPWGE
ncbi:MULTISPECIES: type IV secretion system DNA-binding domain-containing protein [unclassified Bradyrhizobium]|uniref:type IV secretion system DNA-binding domain-containing protein n=1 Tax=Bradyrhizobium sp. USDA 4541 TaxID=2817704 RepID=UPI0020A43987|nr:type IV secretion system DNA-binding domain-containing protein [Bradyrhizobium sp. USDA 4541]MCP1846819.1 hypothetical protein [Bradyrhizobium sp. USDA 4541]